jgi:hypothetical protein
MNAYNIRSSKGKRTRTIVNRHMVKIQPMDGAHFFNARNSFCDRINPYFPVNFNRHP